MKDKRNKISTSDLVEVLGGLLGAALIVGVLLAATGGGGLIALMFILGNL